jgi:hypothetical protein
MIRWSKRGRDFKRGAKPPSHLYSPLQPKIPGYFYDATGWRGVRGEVKTVNYIRKEPSVI